MLKNCCSRLFGYGKKEKAKVEAPVRNESEEIQLAYYPGSKFPVQSVPDLASQGTDAYQSFRLFSMRNYQSNGDKEYRLRDSRFTNRF